MFYFDLACQNITGTPSLGTPSLVQQIQYIGTKKNLHKSHPFSSYENIFDTVVSFTFDDWQCSLSVYLQGELRLNKY